MKKLSLALAFALIGCSDSGTVTRPKLVVTPTLSINDITIAEGESGAFTVTLSPAAADSVTFSWHFGGGTATASSDFTSSDGSAVLAPGESSTSIPVTVASDAVVEQAETIQVTLQNVIGATLGRPVGTATIPGAASLVSFAQQVGPLVQSRCAISACHGGGSHEGGLNLGGGSYTEVRNARSGIGSFIGGTPPQASRSYFYLAVRPGSAPGVPRMPQSGGFLSTAQQTMIRDWIDQGALDN